MHDSTDARERQAKDKLPRYEIARKQVDRMSEIFFRMGDERRGDRMYNCGRKIKAARCKNCGGTHGVRVDMACGARLCPMCAMRRSRAIAAQGLAAMDWMMANAGEEFSAYMISLTQRNVERGDLAREIDRMQDALGRMRQRRTVRDGALGAARTIEITYNHGARTWHPHVHFIMLVRRGYERLGTAELWRDMWADLMGLGYDPHVEAHKLIGDGAVYEVSKYITKFADLLKGLGDAEAVPVIAELDRAIAGRMLHIYTGAWRKARRALKQKDADEMNADELDESAASCPQCGGELLDMLMRWNGMRYELMKEE